MRPVQRQRHQQRRVPLESGYYEAFNEPRVRLVDIRRSPIEQNVATARTEQH